MTAEMTIADLRAALEAGSAAPGQLDDALARIAAEPSAIAGLFPEAGRRCGRGLIFAAAAGPGGWTAEDAARVLMLSALPLRGDALAAEAADLYRHGDAAEKRAVLRALPLLGLGEVDQAPASAAALLLDALRTNDARLVAAALGPYARRLDAAAWRQGVLKCVFMGIPLAVVADIDRRADAELARMLADLAAERRAAGRPVPADAAALLDRLSTLKES